MEKIHELQDAMSVLIRQEEELREACEENGGVETPETIDLEAAKKATKELIQTDGIDMLGRRLVYLSDMLDMLKAEKAAADRKVKAVQKSIDFVKFMVSEAMRLTGNAKVKGKYYGFTAYVSEKNTVNYEEIERIWGQRVYAALEGIGFPSWMEIQFKTTTTALKEAGEDEFIETETADAVRFTKPRGGKE